MPQAVDPHVLAASAGHDLKRIRARREVVLQFLTEHIFDSDAEPDWNVVLRAAQCVDYQRPVWIGPFPAAPPRLVELKSDVLGGGFLRKSPQDPTQVAEWWTIKPAADHLAFHAARVFDDLEPNEDHLLRFMIPFVRNPKGKVVAKRELG